MRITVANFNERTLQMERKPLSEEITQEIVNFVLDSRRWHNDLEELHYRVRDWKSRVRALPDNPPPEPDATEVESQRGPLHHQPAWAALAVELRAKGTSWRSTAREVGKPLSTVRRVVNQRATAGTR